MGFQGRYRDQIHPDKIDSLSISIFLTSLQDSYGGVGANIAYSLALLGDRPVLLGSAGPDAHEYIQQLTVSGVDTRHIYHSQLPTASFNVITDSEENQVGGFYPGAMFDSHTLSFKPWRSSGAIVVVSPHDPKAMRRQVTEARKWNLRLCYDVGQQVSNLEAADIAAGVDAAEILILNDYEISALASKINRSIDGVKAKVPVVVTTLGKGGSVIEGSSVNRAVHVAIARPTKVVDPTGAGDAYRSGFLYGLARGWDLAASARLGATVAVFAIEHQGTQGHKFTLAEVAARYRENFDQELPQSLTETANVHNED